MYVVSVSVIKVSFKDRVQLCLKLILKETDFSRLIWPPVGSGTSRK